MSLATALVPLSASVHVDIHLHQPFEHPSAVIKTYIFQFLSGRDLDAMKATSREHRAFCTDPQLWKLLWERTAIAADKSSIPYHRIASYLDLKDLSNASRVSHQYNHIFYPEILNGKLQRRGYEQKTQDSDQKFYMRSDRRSLALSRIATSQKRGDKAHVIFAHLLLSVQVAATFGVGLECGIKLKDNPIFDEVVLVAAGISFFVIGLIFASSTIIPLHARCRNRWGRQYFENENGVRAMIISSVGAEFTLFSLAKWGNIEYTTPLMLTSGIIQVAQGAVSSKMAARGCRRLCDTRVSCCAKITTQFKKVFQRCKRLCNS